MRYIPRQYNSVDEIVDDLINGRLTTSNLYNIKSRAKNKGDDTLAHNLTQALKLYRALKLITNSKQ